MSVRALAVRALSTPIGLGTKILGSLGLVGAGAGIAAPLAVEHSRGRDHSDVAALVNVSHGSLKKELHRSKRFLRDTSLEQEELTRKLREANDLLAASRNERLNWQSNSSGELARANKLSKMLARKVTKLLKRSEQSK